MNLTGKQIKTIYYALKIASEYADDIDVFELKDNGQDYTHSDFETDCINLMDVIQKKGRRNQILCSRCNQHDCTDWTIGSVVECRDSPR